MMSLFSSCNQCEVFEKEIIPILHFFPQISMKKLSLLKLQIALAIVVMRSHRLSWNMPLFLSEKFKEKVKPCITTWFMQFLLEEFDNEIHNRLIISL